MRATIVGAGSVGLLLGGRLARAGWSVGFVVRRPEAALALREQGVAIRDLASGVVESWAVEAEVGFEAAGPWVDAGPVLLCTRAPDLPVVADALGSVATDPLLVCASNDVDNELLLAERFARVVGLVVRQTSTRSGAREVATIGRGRLVLGAFAGPVEPEVRALAEAFERAGYDVGVSPRIVLDKWLKLCVNLMSAPNALVRREDHRGEAFVEVKVSLLEEARAVLAAEGIEPRSGDGRDRDLSEEIVFQRTALARGESAREIPLYNAVWTALRHGGALEADRYHERIAALGRRHGAQTPVNDRVLEVLRRCVREGHGPESVGARELLAS